MDLHPENNKIFAELVGIKPIRIHGLNMYSEEIDRYEYPDYAADPRLVLREMMKRDDWNDFYKWASDHKQILDYNSQGTVFIRLRYILDTTEGLLVKAGIEWMEKEEGKCCLPKK